ncbi:hypothetical protein BRADI_3g39203v3 [Brachypodium distachyon]|uniref:Uncharacterized protein n=1 Tax=Brachypodium distachyon TaxID=15368 RepID=A0A2K2D243_BRADI|nr:hypothetical protein BRADI_3g39203v3 [Brachypodium distachyon]
MLKHEVAISAQGYSLQKGGCCLEAQLLDSSLVQNTSKQDLNSNESKKRIFLPENKEAHVSTEKQATTGSFA